MPYSLPPTIHKFGHICIYIFASTVCLCINNNFWSDVNGAGVFPIRPLAYLRNCIQLFIASLSAWNIYTDLWLPWETCCFCGGSGSFNFLYTYLKLCQHNMLFLFFTLGIGSEKQRENLNAQIWLAIPDMYVQYPLYFVNASITHAVYDLFLSCQDIKCTHACIIPPSTLQLGSCSSNTR